MSATPSMCDTCHTPGRCCRTFILHHEDFKNVPWLFVAAEMAVRGMPFVPLFQREDGWWRFWCPNLSEEGRCMDYDNRPGTCSSYVPGENSLCVYHTEED